MGVSSAIGNIGIAKQPVKGTPAAVPQFKFKAAGAPSIAPVKERDRYNVTDIGRDPGPAFTSGMRVAGEIPVYMEPSAMALLLYLVLGTNADSGGPTNYVHTLTPANDLPYCTIWRQVGNSIFERFTDCKVGRLAIEGAAGGAFMCTLGVEGIRSTFEASEPVLAALDPAGLLFAEIASQTKFDTVAQTIHRLSMEIQNNAGAYMADDYAPKDIDVGKREISLTVGLRFTGPTAFPKYREFFYGSDAGVELSPVVGTHAFEVLIARNVNLSTKFDMPRVAFAGVPVSMDPGGAPIEIDLAMAVEKPTGTTPIITAVCKDQNATV